MVKVVMEARKLDYAPGYKKRRPLGKEIADQNKLHRKYSAEVVKRVWRAMLLVHVLGYHSTIAAENQEVAERVGLAVEEVKHIRVYYSPENCYSE